MAFGKWLKKSLSAWTRKHDLVSEIRGRGIQINQLWCEQNDLKGVSAEDRNRLERAYRICMEIIFRIRNNRFSDPEYADIHLFHMIVDKISNIRRGLMPYDSLQDGEVFWLEDFMVYSNPSFKMSKEDERKMVNHIRSVAYESYLKEDIRKFPSVEQALIYFSVPYTERENSHDSQVEAN